jgi:two-component system phosphate regulon sensor histidine kinase PhoR
VTPDEQPSPGLYFSADDLINLSRGLRAPLDSMLGTAQELNDAGPVLDAKTLEAIQRNGARQVRLLDNLAALAHLQMDMIPRVRHRIRIDPLVAKLPANVAPELAESEIDLMMPAARSTLMVTGDEHRLLHALRELLRNAIAASEIGGRVGIMIGARLTTVCIEIADYGRGIPADEMDEVLQPFSRTTFDATNRTPGTGLGLTVADGIIRAHDGNLRLTSTPGRGTRATIYLPKA